MKRMKCHASDMKSMKCHARSRCVVLDEPNVGLAYKKKRVNCIVQTWGIVDCVIHHFICNDVSVWICVRLYKPPYHPDDVGSWPLQEVQARAADENFPNLT